MKIFFFLVLLANIIFFLWEYKAVKTYSPLVSQENVKKQILLLSELPDGGSEETIVENASVPPDMLLNNESSFDGGQNNTPVENKSYCYQVGPFLSESLLDDWVVKNKIDINLLTKVSEKSKKVTGFLVYYPQANTFQQSKNHIQLLENKGVTDFWLFRKGELKGVISLGLFTTKKRAVLLQNKLLNSGFSVKIMPRYREESIWYINILTDNQVMIDKMILSEKQSFLACDNF
ncbi:MAG: hypothetical protein QM500_14300 [Methylococcales bacterium]